MVIEFFKEVVNPISKLSQKFGQFSLKSTPNYNYINGKCPKGITNNHSMLGIAKIKLLDGSAQPPCVAVVTRRTEGRIFEKQHFHAILITQYCCVWKQGTTAKGAVYVPAVSNPSVQAISMKKMLTSQLPNLFFFLDHAQAHRALHFFFSALVTLHAYFFLMRILLGERVVKQEVACPFQMGSSKNHVTTDQLDRWWRKVFTQNRDAEIGKGKKSGNGEKQRHALLILVIPIKVFDQVGDLYRRASQESKVSDSEEGCRKVKNNAFGFLGPFVKAAKRKTLNQPINCRHTRTQSSHALEIID